MVLRLNKLSTKCSYTHHIDRRTRQTFTCTLSFQIWMFHSKEAIKIYSQHIFACSTVNCIFPLNRKDAKINPIGTEDKALKGEVRYSRSHADLKGQPQRVGRLGLWGVYGGFWGHSLNLYAIVLPWFVSTLPYMLPKSLKYLNFSLHF